MRVRSHPHCVLGSLGRSRDAPGWGRQKETHECWRGVGSGGGGALQAEPLHKALLLRNHAWGAASIYLP